MRDALLNIEAEDVYEQPLLAEAGEYAEATQGGFGDEPEGPLGYYLD